MATILNFKVDSSEVAPEESLAEGFLLEDS
jgi:hypothetical protein